MVLVFSGCLCCGGSTDLGLSGSDEGYDDVGEFCEPPYIQVGSDCCLDSDSNNICDDDETDQYEIDDVEITSTTQKVVVTTTAKPKATTTTAKPTTTTAAAPAKSKTYECVKALGYDANSVFYFYSTPRCGSQFVATASGVSAKKGVDFTKMQVPHMDTDPKMKILECFYGPFNTQNPQFGQCPVLMCPATGRVQVLSGRATASVRSQMEGFALDCH